MKPIKKITAIHYKSACLLLLWVGFWGFFLPAQALCENSVADAIISLDATDQPLGEVLNDISIEANCRFIVDKRWEAYPITAIVDDEPLYRALKLIFRDINNAIIYGQNRTIRIIVYDEDTPSDTETADSVSINSSQKSVRLPLAVDDETSPQAELDFSETGSHIEDVEQLPEETAESEPEENDTEPEENETGSEESETDTEISDTNDEEPGEEATGETSADLESEEKESESDRQIN